MNPENGGKIELKLLRADGEGAEYDALLQTSTYGFRTTARVADRQVTFGEWQTESALPPPEWLLADARAALKTALRTGQVEGRYPRRITRWRPEPTE
jgi:hypothetical protein